jgi:hypothetical protein
VVIGEPCLYVKRLAGEDAGDAPRPETAKTKTGFHALLANSMRHYAGRPRSNNNGTDVMMVAYGNEEAGFY